MFITVYRAGDKKGPCMKSQFTKDSEVWLFIDEKLLSSSECKEDDSIIWKATIPRPKQPLSSNDYVVVVKEIEREWEPVKLDACKDAGRAGVNTSYVHSSALLYFESKQCKSRNDIAEVKAACNWYWPSIKLPDSLTKISKDSRILAVVECANKHWNDQLETERRNGNVYSQPHDDSDSEEIFDLKMDIGETDEYIHWVKSANLMERSQAVTAKNRRSVDQQEKPRKRRKHRGLVLTDRCLDTEAGMVSCTS